MRQQVARRQSASATTASLPRDPAVRARGIYAAFTALTWPWRSGRAPGATHLGLLATLPRVSHRAAQRPPKVLSPMTHLSRCTDSCTAYAARRAAPRFLLLGNSHLDEAPTLPLSQNSLRSTTQPPLRRSAYRSPWRETAVKPTLAATWTRTARDARRRVVQESTGNSYKSTRVSAIPQLKKKQGQESPTDNSYSQY